MEAMEWVMVQCHWKECVMTVLILMARNGDCQFLEASHWGFVSTFVYWGCIARRLNLGCNGDKNPNEQWLLSCWYDWNCHLQREDS